MNLFTRAYNRHLSNLFRQIAPRSKSLLKIQHKITNHTKKYDYIFLVNSLSYAFDIQDFIRKTKKNCHKDSRVVVIYFNFIWKPILDLATKVGLRSKDISEPNWLTTNDIENFFSLEGFELIKREKRLLLPVELGIISYFVNRFVAPLPLINSLCLNSYLIFRQTPTPVEKSVSVVIPARNEKGNIKGMLSKLPKLGIKTEIIFVEGNSSDDTYKAIEKEINEYKGELECYLYKQPGVGKADAVRLGFRKAKGEILMILDADLTVSPNDLKKFYSALASGHADFANGSRLVYPLENQAMRTLNYLGNKFFSIVFTYLLGQKIKDTLCGTKVLFRKDYLEIEKNRKFFGDFDPFGDFDLLFGATRLNLKIIEIPVRYKNRKYGVTNISRFTHGLLLLRMTNFAALKIKFI